MRRRAQRALKRSTNRLDRYFLKQKEKKILEELRMIFCWACCFYRNKIWTLLYAVPTLEPVSYSINVLFQSETIKVSTFLEDVRSETYDIFVTRYRHTYTGGMKSVTGEASKCARMVYSIMGPMYLSQLILEFRNCASEYVGRVQACALQDEQVKENVKIIHDNMANEESPEIHEFIRRNAENEGEKERFSALASSIVSRTASAKAINKKRAVWYSDVKARARKYEEYLRQFKENDLISVKLSDGALTA